MTSTRNGYIGRLLALGAIALLAAGVLTLTQERKAEADIQSLTFDTNVVLGTGTVVATFTADEDAESDAEAVRIVMPNPLVTGLTEDDCTTSLAAACAIAAENPCTNPAPPANTFCAQYVPVADIDGNATPGTFTASFSIDIDCTNELNVVAVSVTVENLLDTDGFQPDDSETALIICFPNIDVDNANVIINKDFDGDPAQSFEYQINTDEVGGGCFVSIDGGPATLLADGGTFSMTADDEAWLFCGPGTYMITELQGIGWVFVSSACEQLFPAQQPIPGSTVTVVIESNLPWDCLFTNAVEDPTIPDLLIEKVCVGEADATYTVDLIRDAGPGVSNAIECDGVLYFPDLLAANYTIEELIAGPDADAIETSIDCGAAGSAEGTSITVAVPAATTAPAVNITCTITNTAPEGEGDPETPDIIVKKECVGDLGEATFSISVGDETLPVECGTEVTFVDVAAGPVDVSETIEGGDGIQTQIACSDLTQAEGTTVTLAVPEAVEGQAAVNIFCVFINSAEDLGDLLCSCTCCGLELDIDLNNANTNTIGIDNANTNNNANANDNLNDNFNANANENDNQNENTQDQTNSQDQDNANEQTNNITSSPEVNIDFD